MNTCPVCSKTNEIIALLNIYELTFTICDSCGAISIQETGQIIQMSQFNFEARPLHNKVSGLIAVAWAMGELNEAWPHIIEVE